MKKINMKRIRMSGSQISLNSHNESINSDVHKMNVLQSQRKSAASLLDFAGKNLNERI